MFETLKKILNPDNSVTPIHLANAKVKKQKNEEEKDPRRKFEMQMAQFYSPSFFHYQTMVEKKESVKVVLDIINIFREEWKK